MTRSLVFTHVSQVYKLDVSGALHSTMCGTVQASVPV